MFGGVSDFSCKYTHGTSTVGGGGKATVRTTVRTENFIGLVRVKITSLNSYYLRMPKTQKLGCRF